MEWELKWKIFLSELRMWTGELMWFFVHIDSFYVIARCNPGILSLATVLKIDGFSVKIFEAHRFLLFESQ